jgi:hypothetical protein
LRLDAHHSFSEAYPLVSLASILKRNRFDGSVLVTDVAQARMPAASRFVSTLAPGPSAEPPDDAAASDAGPSGIGAGPSGRPVGERPAPLHPGAAIHAAVALDLAARGGTGTADSAALPEFVRAVVIQADCVDPHLLDEYQRDPLFGGRFRGLCCDGASGLPENLQELERRNLTLDILNGLPLVPAIAEIFPALRVAIVHLGSPGVGSGDWDRWASALEAAARIPQAVCKLSGLIGLAPSPWRAEVLRPYVQHALSVFGPGRLMFGSGWPASLPEHAWKETLAAFTQSIGAQSIEVREQLLGATAARFYGIAA